MDIEALRMTLQQPSLASLGLGFLVGFVFTFNPVALASIPVSLAYVTKAREARTATLYGGMFIVGMVAVQVLLGVAAALGGQWAAQLLGRQWGLVLGPLLILLGLAWPGWIRLPLPAIPLRAKRVGSSWGAIVLGMAFAIAVCPFCTPALAPRCSVARCCWPLRWGARCRSSLAPWRWAGSRACPCCGVSRRRLRWPARQCWCCPGCTCSTRTFFSSPHWQFESETGPAATGAALQKTLPQGELTWFPM